MSEIWDTPSPYNSGAQKPLFGRLRNLTATLTAYIFGMKHDIDNRVKCVDNYKGSPTSYQNVMNFVNKRLQTRPAFLPTLRKFCILLHCHASQTDISKRNSTKLCQLMGSQSP